jgi:hypothetical protein
MINVTIKMFDILSFSFGRELLINHVSSTPIQDVKCQCHRVQTLACFVLFGFEELGQICENVEKVVACIVQHSPASGSEGHNSTYMKSTN